MSRRAWGMGLATLLACNAAPAKKPASHGNNDEIVSGASSNDASVVAVLTPGVGGGSGFHLCSGVVVATPTGPVVLTAAHCVINIDAHREATPAETSVFVCTNVGDATQTAAGSGCMRTPSTIRIVAGWHDGDLAVIYGADLGTRPNGTPIPSRQVATGSYIASLNAVGGFYGAALDIVGFGLTDASNNASAGTQNTGQVTGNGESRDQEANTLRSAPYIELEPSPSTACFGDSGGPAFLHGTGVVVGIAHSTQLESCTGASYYTDVAAAEPLLQYYLASVGAAGQSPLDANLQALGQFPRGMISDDCTGQCSGCTASQSCDTDPNGSCTCLDPAPACPADCGSGCGDGQVCAFDYNYCASCQPLPADPDGCGGECPAALSCVFGNLGFGCLPDPCGGQCQGGQMCQSDQNGANWSCVTQSSDPCNGQCQSGQLCQVGSAGPECGATATPGDPCNGACTTGQQCASDGSGNYSCQTIDLCNGACTAAQQCTQQVDGTWGCTDPCNASCQNGSSCTQQSDGSWVCVDGCNDACVAGTNSCQQQSDGAWACVDGCNNACAGSTSCTQQGDGTWACVDGCGNACQGNTTCQQDSSGNWSCQDPCQNACAANASCQQQASGWCCVDNCNNSCSTDSVCQQDGSGNWVCVDQCGNACGAGTTCQQQSGGAWGCVDGCNNACVSPQTCQQQGDGTWSCQ